MSPYKLKRKTGGSVREMQLIGKSESCRASTHGSWKAVYAENKKKRSWLLGAKNSTQLRANQETEPPTYSCKELNDLGSRFSFRAERKKCRLSKTDFCLGRL